MNRIPHQKALQLLIHVTSWMLVFGLPFLIFSRNNEGDLGRRLLHHGVILLSMISVFYTNFFVLTERFLFRRKLLPFLCCNLLLIVGMGVAVHFWKEAYPLWAERPHDVGPFPARPVLLLVFRDILPLLLITGLSVAIKATGKWYRLEVLHREEEQRRAQAELQNLRQQINPHFLFNTLNNIYALIAVGPDKAQSAVLDLSKLLRYALYDNGSERVALKDEVEFIVRYVELMRIRLSSEVELRMDVASVSASILPVPPMLLISLVENAFKHGTSPNRKSFIDIGLYLEEGDRLVCRIANSHFPKDGSDRSGSGIGLENLRRRLDILYPGQYSYEASVVDGVYRTELILSL